MADIDVEATPEIPTRDSLLRQVAAAEEEMALREGYRMRAYFQDEGPYRRELYPKHIAWFAASAVARETLLLAANRVGKSEAGAYALTCHLTGLYPDWWVGRRFDRPIRAWACVRG